MHFVGRPEGRVQKVVVYGLSFYHAVGEGGFTPPPPPHPCPWIVCMSALSLCVCCVIGVSGECSNGGLGVAGDRVHSSSSTRSACERGSAGGAAHHRLCRDQYIPAECGSCHRSNWHRHHSHQAQTEQVLHLRTQLNCSHLSTQLIT